MTREEIIDELCRLRSDITNAGGYVNRTDAQKNRFAQALSEEIQRLQTEPCEDSISRQAVLAGLANIAKAKAKSDAQKAMMGRAMFFIERLPSVQPEPFINKPCVSEQACREDKMKVLEKIKAEIEAKCCITVGRECDGAITLHDVFEIIDRHMKESEDKE